jgi:hypothetical protein
MAKTQTKQLVVCVDNEGYAVSLEKRKIHVSLRDAGAEKHRMLRIVDESGEDYLYPKTFFRAIAPAAGREEGSSRGVKPTRPRRRSMVDLAS